MTITEDIKKHTNILSAYMPLGRAFAGRSIDGSVFRNLLRGMAYGMMDVEDAMDLFRSEILPDQLTPTDNRAVFLSEWESALGIPDGCFPSPETQTDDKRRRNIGIKIASLGVQTAADFTALAALFGQTVTVLSGIDHDSVNGYGTALPDINFGTAKAGRFTIVVTLATAPGGGFPYVFPFTFGGEDLAIIQCLFNKLKPANCNIYYTA